MRKLLSACAALFLFAFAFGQASNVLKHQRLDVEQFERAVMTLQADPFLHCSRATWDSTLRWLKDTLRSALSPVQQFGVYSRALVVLKDGHTTMAPSKEVLKEWGKMEQCLPFDMVLVNKRLFVSPLHPIDADNLLRRQLKSGGVVSEKINQQLLPGMEILAINDWTVKQWVEHMARYIPSDEDGMDFKYFVAGQLFDFYRYLSLPTANDSAKVTYIFKKDTLSRMVKLGPPHRITYDERLNPRLPKNTSITQVYYSVIGGKTAYLRISSFKEAKGEAYFRQLEEAFSTFSKRKTKQLILDLRGNTGGVIQTELLRYLMPSGKDAGFYGVIRRHSKSTLKQLGVLRRDPATKTYLQNVQNLERAGIKGNEDQKVPRNPSYGHFKGKIVVLTDERTFSAASIVAANLRFHRDAILVGAPAGGSFYGGNAGTLPVRLKKSKLIVVLNPNLFGTAMHGLYKDDDIKQPAMDAENLMEIPLENYEKNKKQRKPEDDKILKIAEKAFKTISE